jgi:membrane-associated phospholipid phosphatase
VLVAGLAGRGRMFREMTFRLLVTYLGCDLLYVLFPVYGPHFGGGAAAGQFAEGFFRGVSEALRATGDSPGTAFPSSHVAGVLTAAFLAFRWFRRPAAWFWAVGALAVAASTVYTRNHFLVDVAAGALVALLLQAAVSWLAVGRAGNPLRPVFPCVLPVRIVAPGPARIPAGREGGGS